MPLIQCPDCRKRVSDTAVACPECGRAINDPRMDKLRATVLTIKESVLQIVDRGRIADISLLLVALTMLVFAWRAPEEGLGAALMVPSQVLESDSPTLTLLSVALLLSLALNVVLLRAHMNSRATMRAEIDRMAERKRALERRLEPDRPGTYTGTAP